MGIHTSKLICYYYVTTDTYETLANTTENNVLAFTAHRTGKLAVELDLSELITAAEGGTVTCRLKHAIDEATPVTIDIAEFIIGTDTVHPTLTGWVDHQVADSVLITLQCSSAPTAGREIDFKIIEAG